MKKKKFFERKTAVFWFIIWLVSLSRFPQGCCCCCCWGLLAPVASQLSRGDNSFFFFHWLIFHERESIFMISIFSFLLSVPWDELLSGGACNMLTTGVRKNQKLLFGRPHRRAAETAAAVRVSWRRRLGTSLAPLDFNFSPKCYLIPERLLHLLQSKQKKEGG